jgi:hypothetical protein
MKKKTGDTNDSYYAYYVFLCFILVTHFTELQAALLDSFRLKPIQHKGS